MAEDAEMIVVVGIGADGMAGLAPASHAELTRATVVYGSRRQLDLLDDTVTADRRQWPSPMLNALDTLRDTAGDVHVVASGDPMLHGVGGLLMRLIGADQVTVLPHVSCVTLACVRLGWPVQETEVISLMIADPHTAIRRGGKAVVLCRDGSSPAALARLLADSGRGDSELTVFEQLGGPAERRRDATAREWAADPPNDVDTLNVVAVRYLPDDPRLSVLPDDAFAHDGQITKQSMRAVTLAALAPQTGELLWDVGAGSGSIAIQWCRSGSRCKAVAFERDEQRRKRIAENALAHGAVVDVRGEAPAAFDEAVLSEGGVDGVPRPTAIFVGGGVTQPGLLEACYERLPTGGRLVANAVTAESEAVLAQRYSRLGGELRRFQHYRGEPVGEFTGWRPAMPVTQWSVTKR
jgi:precorrin-6Y C5,15-methyltransferase (decarboxylating)